MRYIEYDENGKVIKNYVEECQKVILVCTPQHRQQVARFMASVGKQVTIKFPDQTKVRLTRENR